MALNVYLFTLTNTETKETRTRHLKARNADQATEDVLKRRWVKEWFAENPGVPFEFKTEETEHRHQVDREGKAYKDAFTAFRYAENTPEGVAKAIEAYLNCKDLM